MSDLKDTSNKFGSFRDPDAFVFAHEGKVHRCLMHSYTDAYEHLISSGLYEKLCNEKLLVKHEELTKPLVDNAYKILLPDQIPVISYPYEWSFSMLKAAALLTLKIQKMALSFNMSLKDATAFNIQFLNGNPIFIDTSSFERYKEGEPWVAYGQFCRHFLAPLSLMKYTDVNLNRLMLDAIDGIPLSLCSKLLPWNSWFNLNLLSNIHLHAKSENKFADKKSNLSSRKVSKAALNGILTMLESGIKNLSWKSVGTEWAEYYQDNNYTTAALAHKKQRIIEYLDLTKPKSLTDFGANNGHFSRLASDRRIRTLSVDIDVAAVEQNFKMLMQQKEEYILPLRIDLCNPSPAIGWGNHERIAFLDRAKADVGMMLALIHHLVLSNHISFQMVAHLMAETSTYLIIEFIPDTDSQVQWILKGKKNDYSFYTKANFESAFSKYFEFNKVEKIEESERFLYLMKRKNNSAKH